MDKNKLFYHRNLLERKLRIIAKKRMTNIVAPATIKVTECFQTEVIEPLPTADNFSEIKLPYKYGSVDDYMWIKAEFADLKSDCDYYGYFDFGTGTGGLTVGSETLLYLNGQEHSGVDLNHKEIYLGNLTENQELVFRTWSGVADESRLEELEYIQGIRELESLHTISSLQLFELDHKINNLYYNMFAMIEAYKALSESNVTASSRIINDLSKIFLEYDEHDLTREMMYQLDEELQAVIDGYDDKSLVQMIAVGQTHIDLAWLWRVKHTREKAARSFSTMLNLINQNPQFTFLQSQPQLFAFLKEDYPNLYERIKTAVANGNLEIDGAMWLESDCNIPSGESLTRQVLYGKQFIKNEFGKDSKLLWMPDVFGYSWAMPQILKKSGVDVFCTTKMQWNQYNRMPFNSFKWRGIDGSEIATHLIEDFKFYTINADSLVTGWEKYRDKDVTNEVLFQYGFGDGGGGPRQDDIELVKRYDKIPGLPNIKYERASQYFERLEKNLDDSKGYVHHWDGELYLELHRGTFTSQARMKLLNRRLEYKLRYIEMLTVLIANNGVELPNIQAKICECWQGVMLNQFHDIIPGSSINQVYKDAELVYSQCFAKIAEIEAEIETHFNQLENSLMVFNSYHQPISGYVEFESDESLQFTSEGQKLNAVRDQNRYKIEVNQLKPLAFTKIEFEQVAEVTSEIVTELVDSANIENEFYKVTINNIGQITSLYDKQLNRQLVKPGKLFNKLVSYEDRPLNWDAWDIDIYYDKRERIVDQANSKLEVTTTEFETVVKVELAHFNSTIIQQITIDNNNKRIDIKHDVDYRDDHRLLRVLFETDIRATDARFDIQSGNVKRPTHRNTSWDMQKFEVLGHKWADISNNSYGVSILNDCKYGYSAYDSTIGLTLIKAATYPDKTQDIGNHVYTYSIYPHSGDVLTSDIDRQAHSLNEKLTYSQVNYPQTPIVAIENDNIFVDAIKLAEESNDVIVRIHEWRNTESTVNIDCEYTDTNLLEVELDQTTDQISNYEIKTLKLKEPKND